MATELKGIKVGSESASYNANGNREYEAVYMVDTSAGTIPATNVLACHGLPRLRTRYLYDYTAICTSIDPQRRPNSQTLWDVRVRWEVTSSQKKEKPDSDKPPWEQRPDPSWDEVPLDIVTPVDLKGKKFVDTAGIPFDPPPTIPQSNQMLTILRNEIGFSPTDARFYGNTVNDGDWFGFPKGSVKLLMPTATGIWEAGQLYWQVVYRLEIMCGWVWSDTTNKYLQLLWEPYAVPNIGAFHIPDGGGEATRNLDGSGDPMTEPQHLDGDGHLLGPDDPTYWLWFSRFRLTDFSKYFDWLGKPASYSNPK